MKTLTKVSLSYEWPSSPVVYTGSWKLETHYKEGSTYHQTVQYFEDKLVALGHLYLLVDDARTVEEERATETTLGEDQS